MFRYRSEPLRAWNWEEKSPLLGDGKGPRTEQGINSSPGSNETHRARREISRREREQRDNHPQNQSWKVKNTTGGRSPQERERWVTTAVTRHQHSRLAPLSPLCRQKHCNNEAHQHPNTWLWLDIQLPRGCSSLHLCLSGITHQTQQLPDHISAQAACGRQMTPFPSSHHLPKVILDERNAF